MAQFSPDGAQIVMMGAGGIYLMDADGGNLRRIDPLGDHGGLDWAEPWNGGMRNAERAERRKERKEPEGGKTERRKERKEPEMAERLKGGGNGGDGGGTQDSEQYTSNRWSAFYGR